MRTEGIWGIVLHLTEVRRQFRAPATFTPVERIPGTHRRGSPTVDLEAVT